MNESIREERRRYGRRLNRWKWLFRMVWGTLLLLPLVFVGGIESGFLHPMIGMVYSMLSIGAAYLTARICGDAV